MKKDKEVDLVVFERQESNQSTEKASEKLQIQPTTYKNSSSEIDPN